MLLWVIINWPHHQNLMPRKSTARNISKQVEGFIAHFNRFLFFSRRSQQAAPKTTGRNGSKEVRYVSTHYELEHAWRNTVAFSCCHSHVRVWLCNVRFWTAVPACGSTLWQEAHSIKTLLLIYFGYRPIACFQLFYTTYRHPKIRSEHSHLYEKSHLQLQDLADMLIAASVIHRCVFSQSPSGGTDLLYYLPVILTRLINQKPCTN